MKTESGNSCCGPDGDFLTAGIRLFNERRFFACHEVIEDGWRPTQGETREFLQSLIHLAAGFHHWQRGNKAGTIGQLRKGLAKLSRYRPEYQGLDTAKLHHDTDQALRHIESGDNGFEFPQVRFTRHRDW